MLLTFSEDLLLFVDDLVDVEDLVLVDIDVFEVLAVAADPDVLPPFILAASLAARSSLRLGPSEALSWTTSRISKSLWLRSVMACFNSYLSA